MNEELHDSTEHNHLRELCIINESNMNKENLGLYPFEYKKETLPLYESA